MEESTDTLLSKKELLVLKSKSKTGRKKIIKVILFFGLVTSAVLIVTSLILFEQYFTIESQSDDFNQTDRNPDSSAISGSAELETDRNSAKPFDLKIIGRWKSKSSINALGYFKRLGVGFLAPIVARIKSDQQIKLTQLGCRIETITPLKTLVIDFVENQNVTYRNPLLRENETSYFHKSSNSWRFEVYHETLVEKVKFSINEDMLIIRRQIDDVIGKWFYEKSN